jgi:hypothetical protein
VMGWFDYHLWEFTIGKQKYSLPVDDDWGTEPRIEAAKVRLRDVLKPERPSLITLTTSGMAGDIGSPQPMSASASPGVSDPRYIGGERNGPLEDCGGIPGFYELLEAIADLLIRTMHSQRMGGRLQSRLIR